MGSQLHFTVDGAKYCFRIRAQGIIRVTEAGFDLAKPPAPGDLARNLRYWMEVLAAFACAVDDTGALTPVATTADEWEERVQYHELPFIGAAFRAAVSTLNDETRAADTLAKIESHEPTTERIQ